MQLQKSTARGRRNAIGREAVRYRNRSVGRKLVLRFLRPLLSFLALAVPFRSPPPCSLFILRWREFTSSDSPLRFQCALKHAEITSELMDSLSNLSISTRTRRLTLLESRVYVGEEFIREKLDFMCQMMLNWSEPDEQRHSQRKNGAFFWRKREIEFY